MNVRITRIGASCLAALVCLCSHVLASGGSPNAGEPGQLDRISDLEAGMLLLRFGGGTDQWVAPQLQSKVDIDVTGPIVRVVLTQTFSNPSADWAEAVYVFPLPENAAVDHMRMQIGERIIEGQIKEREAAKKVYQQAKKAGRRASLVEQERPNMFTTSVAINPAFKQR